MRETRYGIVGAGNGGKAMAAHLALKGFPVGLYNRTPEHIAAIQSRKGIELSGPPGVAHGFGELRLITSDIEELASWADILMVVVPAVADAAIAKRLAPHLSPRHIVVLNPGGVGGALEFKRIIEENGAGETATVAEAETLLYACRSEGPTKARIFRIKNAVSLAALPATENRRVLEALSCAFPQFTDGKTVLHTSLNNMNAIFHPAPTLLNAGRIESTGGDFEFYVDGMTPSVTHVMSTMDRERITVAAALGIRARPIRKWLERDYGATGDSLYEAIRNQVGYRGIKAPDSLEHRYILEDVPTILVPIVALGHRYGVSVTTIESIVNLANVVHGTDYWRKGRTLEQLGIDRLSVDELMSYVRGDG